jgi:hypothetical protein
MSYCGTKNAKSKFKEDSQYRTTPVREFFGPSKARVACHFLHSDMTEDIWLKSAVEGESGVSLIAG